MWPLKCHLSLAADFRIAFLIFQYEGFVDQVVEAGVIVEDELSSHIFAHSFHETIDFLFFVSYVIGGVAGELIELG